MSFPNRDAQILAHILEYCNRIEKTLSRFGREFDVFLDDQDYMDSVSMNLRCGFFLIFRLDELKIWTIKQAAVFLVDEFGIVGDQAVLGLPEDLIENRHRYDAASNQLREHIARTDALQLIDVAQQQEFCVLL